MAGKTPVPAAAYVKPLFTAVEIPDELLLHRSLVMPRMAAQDLHDALLLEVRSHSPFGSDDVAWGFVSHDSANGARRFDLVMASRRQINEFVQGRWPELSASGQVPEAWAVAGLPAPVVLGGFGEGRRMQHAAGQRRLHLGLLALALALATAVVLTPTAQLRLRALEAVKAFSGVASGAAPLVRKRDELVVLTDRVRAIATITADRVDPAAVLEYLTRVLPDDTYLYSLDIKGARIVASGHTVDASALLQRLSADPRLRNVRSPTAVTRQPGATKEAFTVEFTLEPLPAAVALQARPPASVPQPAAAAPARPGSSPFVIGGSAP